MFKLVAYRFNNKGQEMARFEQLFVTQEEMQLRYDEIKKEFGNYQLFKNNELLSTNMVVNNVR